MCAGRMTEYIRGWMGSKMMARMAKSQLSKWRSIVVTWNGFKAQVWERPAAAAPSTPGKVAPSSPGMPPLVYLPGTGQAASACAGVLEALQIPTDRRVLIFEYPGFGGSYKLDGGNNNEGFTIPQILEFLEIVLGDDQLNLKAPFDMLGYSAGGSQVFLYAKLHPERVRKAFIIAPGLVGYNAQPKLQEAFDSGDLSKMFAFSDLQGLRAYWTEILALPMLPEPFASALVYNAKHDYPDGYFNRALLKLCEGFEFTKWWEQLPATNKSAEVECIVWVGLKDRCNNPDFADEWAERLGGNKGKSIKNEAAGHFGCYTSDLQDSVFSRSKESLRQFFFEQGSPSKL